MSASRPAALGGMEILAEISSGGMGEVFLARRRGARGFEKLVAIKTIRRDLALRQDLVAMFLDEARLMARLDHPSIAQVHDFGEDEGVLYLAMEYVAGVALTKLIRTPPIPPSAALRLIAETCRGLHAAHELRDISGRSLGVVHRDVSPQNVIVTFDGHIKILDFGVALIRNREAEVTNVGMVRGKLSYMAPEQLSGKRVDRRADIYAASVVLYELLTGKKLFSPTLRDRSSEAPRPPGVDPEIDALVLRGLSWDPADRFADAREMAISLESAAAGAPPMVVEELVQRELSGSRTLHEDRLQRLVGGVVVPTVIVPVEEQTLGEATFQSVRPIAAEEVEPPVEAIAQPAPASRADAKIAGGAVATVVLLSLLWIATRPPAEPLEVITAPSTQVEAARTASTATTEVTAAAETAPIKAPDPKPARRSKRAPAKEEIAAPAIVPSTSFGWLTVGADPYGIVVIDGEDLGVSPLADHRVTAGEHKIELLHPTTRQLLRRKTITVAEDQRLIVKM